MQIHRYERIGSTSDRLKEMAEAGAPDWTVVTAKEQTAGRGRQGRKWHSPPGSLYMSVLARPLIKPAILTRVPLAASLALGRAIGPADSRLTLKWPNDLLFEDRKLAGVLPEARSSRDVVNYLVIGYGVNINRPASGIPEALGQRTSYLEEFITAPDTEALTIAIVEELSAILESLEGQAWELVRREWSSQVSWGREYIHRDGVLETRGVTVDVDGNGALVLDTADGRVTVSSGELVASS
jgi:BirA family biotin operon repressor/biotin-[acetyl-CoA-carboxylase] ligase